MRKTILFALILGFAPAAGATLPQVDASRVAAAAVQRANQEAVRQQNEVIRRQVELRQQRAQLEKKVATKTSP